MTPPNTWPPDALEDFEERAGIMEYEGNLPRDKAEELAYSRVMLTHGIQPEQKLFWEQD